MMRMKTLACAAALLFAFGAAHAQTGTATERPSVFNDYLNTKSPGSFLHIDGLSFSSSAGFSFFSGGGGESFGMGYYMGHFGLALSRSISLNWDIGVGSVMRGTNEYSEPRFFVPNVDLTYRPSDSFMLRLEFHQYRHPGYYGMFRR